MYGLGVAFSLLSWGCTRSAVRTLHSLIHGYKRGTQVVSMVHQGYHASA